MTLACMERVLRAEPANLQARAGANWAKGKLGLVIGDLFNYGVSRQLSAVSFQ